jgi:hypothetical protein
MAGDRGRYEEMANEGVPGAAEQAAAGNTVGEELPVDTAAGVVGVPDEAEGTPGAAVRRVDPGREAAALREDLRALHSALVMRLDRMIELLEALQPVAQPPAAGMHAHAAEVQRIPGRPGTTEQS